MEQFKRICQELDLSLDKENQFKEAWKKFENAQKKTRCKSFSYHEAFLAWLLINKFKPKTIIELGGQFGHSGLIWLDAAARNNLTFITVELGKDPRNKYGNASIGDLRFLPRKHPNLIKIWGDATEELPKLLEKYDVGLVFHDAAHTWDHVLSCVEISLKYDIIQTCHDCKEGMWKPNKKTRYGYIHAERPIFDMKFNETEEYYYEVLEDAYGFGLAIPKKRLNRE